MSGFGGGQDWEVVNAGRKGGQHKPQTAAEKSKALATAKRTGQVVTEQKFGAGGNATSGGHGPMGTTAGAKAVKLEGETEVFKTERAGLGLGKAIMQARTAKKPTQKQLATSLNEKPQVIMEYESGKAIPNPQIISKIERALGVKLPRPPKKKPVKDAAT